MNKERLSNILFGIALMLLFVPMLQEEYQWIAVGGLDGWTPNLAKDSSLTPLNWWTNKYQIAKDNYRIENFGFRNWAIRLNNQSKYSLYSASESDNIVVGKENYLYGNDYVQAYVGDDFVGEEIIRGKLRRFKKVQDTLSQLGKHMVVMIMPNKADYFPEHLPQKAAQMDRSTIKTNYDTYARLLKEYGIHHVDLNAYYRDIKDTIAYPLFPQGGIHMSDYGSCLFADTLAKHIEEHLEKDLPEMFWTEVPMLHEIKHGDNDAELALNLIFELPRYKLPYPNIQYRTKGKYKPKVLAVGDSFYWQFMNWGGHKQIFDNGHFWYYNRDAHPKGKQVKDLKIGQEIADKEVIFIVNTAFNLWRFGFDFDMDLYKHFFGKEILKDPVLLEELIQEKIANGRKNAKWMKFIASEAKKSEKPFEEVLYNHASFIIRKQLQK